MGGSMQGARRVQGSIPRFWLWLTAVLVGAAVMVLELLGTRVIGAFYGVDILVWSSLISTTLVCLAVGYFLGGRLGAIVPRARLHHLLGLAGLLVAIIPALNRTVLESTLELGPRLGSLLSAFLLFGWPLILLAMVSPILIQAAAVELETAGAAAGSIYALSTVGSVFGTLGLAYGLLPFLGGRVLLLGLAGALFLLAGALLWVERRTRRTIGLAGLALMLLAGLGLGSSGAKELQAEGFRLLFEAENIHGRIRVVDDETQGVRWMLSNASIISGQERATGRSVFPYLDIIELMALGQSPGRARRALIIGLGAGEVPRRLAMHGIPADAVEIDPAVVGAARRFFGFTPTGEVAIGDARRMVRDIAGPYDLIVHDCFTNGIVPGHVLTQEMFTDLARILSPDGLLVLSYFGEPRRDRSIAAIEATLRAVFPEVRRFIPVQTDDPVDNIFLAARHPISVPDPARHKLSEPLSRLAGELTRLQPGPAAGDEPALTDDLNPVEYYQMEKAASYRRQVFAGLRPELFY